MTYNYFTKDEIEAKLSKILDCGKVAIQLTKGDDYAKIIYGKSTEPNKIAVDKIAKMVTSKDNACAVVDCDEGMLIFNSHSDREWYRG